MAYGRFSKGRSRSKSTSKRTSYASRGRRSTAKRRSSGRSAGRSAVAKPQTIRIVFAQEPGGAGLANPALPVPPSTVTEKTRKAKL